MAEQQPPEAPKRFWEPISPPKRKRLQACFTQGCKVASTGNFDYATDMFMQCVLGDGANLLYLQNYIGNLQKKYNNNKKGSKLASISGVGTKASIKKASMQKDWEQLFKSGLEMLKLNPWDTFALCELAVACEHLECSECELLFYRSALEANIKDPAVNRKAGIALARQGHFDQAINCWRRVEEANPKDEEARKMIGNLSVETTIKKGGYTNAESAQDVRSDKSKPGGQGIGTGPGGGGSAGGKNFGGGGASEADMPGRRATPEELLKKAIQKDPANVTNYLQLAELYKEKLQFTEAEQMFSKALAASGGDANIREKLEDAQIYLRGVQIEIAKQRALSEQTEEAKQLHKDLVTEQLKFELEVYRARSDRNPSVLALAYELAVRLERLGMFQEAIRAYQKARGDETRKGGGLLGLGRCFVQIKQYALAMNHFKEAIAAISDLDQDLKKEALYLAGKLAMGLKDADSARLYLSQLASLDYAYRDVALRLDKLNEGDDPGLS